MVHPKAHVTHRNPVYRPVIAASLGPDVIGYKNPHVDQGDPATALTGALYRFGAAPPNSDDALVSRLKTFVEEWCVKNLTPLPPESDLSVEHWLEQTNYPDWRKKQLKAIHEKITNPYDEKLFKVKSFIKDETYPSYKHARGINSRTDEFKTLVGPVIKLIEKEVFKLHWFIKKIPVRERPSYIKKN